jgi:putative DNA primase/helicase
MTSPAIEYVRAGLALVPIPVGTKGPRTPGWNLRENCITTEAQAARLNGENIGLAHSYCHPTPTGALDIDDFAAAESWLDAHGIDLAALMMADDAVQIRSGRPNRAKAMYRLPEPLPSVVVKGEGGDTALELRCASAGGLTVQDVLPPSIHPDTGQPYVWAGAGDWHAIPDIPAPLHLLWRALAAAKPDGTRADLHIVGRSDEAAISGRKRLHPDLLRLARDCPREAGMGVDLSGLVWRVIRHMLRRGASDTEVVSVLTDRDLGVSSKALEKPQPAAWLCAQIAKARASTPAAEEPAGEAANEWPEPQPLTAKVAAEPYPLDALPGTILAAVEEVAGFVKAPIALVASSALGALSLACQAHVNVMRDEKLQGPVSLNLLTIADSGERKSTCDGFFSSAIRQFEAEQAEAMKPELQRHEADMGAWTAERDGLLSAIKDASKKGKATEKLRADLAQLQADKPEPPRVPRILLSDETPENLAWSLARVWPSAGVVSSEAGLIFGAHGMGKDSVMRNLALLNVLWDGGTHSVGRRTSESFTVRGARLTVALQVQEPTLRSFFEKTGQLARGTGFLSRFLVAWPESTQGHRPFTDAPANWPHLAAFHRRTAAILAMPIPMGDDDALSPMLLSLAPRTKAAWVEYHDAIEGEFASGGELYDVRDVASKSADNAARMAALFQMFEYGAGTIRPECFEAASRIAAWHLNESRRFFGELALPVELADAARLDTRLTEHCRRERTASVGKNHVRQRGPLRDGARLDAAIRELESLDRLRLHKDGKRLTLHVNPALLGVTP